MSGIKPVRSGTNRTRVAWAWREYTALSGATTYGRSAFTAGYDNDLGIAGPRGADETIYPSAVICQTGGLLVVKDRTGTEYGFTAVAGVEYAIGGVTDFDGTNTAAANLLFLYNT